MKKKTLILVIIFTLFITVLVSLKILIGFIPIPLWIRSISHSVFEPENLYSPIVSDTFLFYEKGFTRQYTLKPKYLDYYQIGIISEKQNIPMKYKFNGKLKAEFFWKDKLLFEKTSTSSLASWQADDYSEHFKDIYLLTFEIPLMGKYKDDISVRLTVIEPDEQLREYRDTIKLTIGVSAIP